MDAYRISNNREEIIKLVQKKFNSESLMTVWQKHPISDERLFMCEAKFYSLHPYDGTFSIIIDEEQRKLMTPELDFYFLLKVQDFVFKTRLSLSQPIDQSVISFQIPTDVRLKELRLHPRVYISNEEKRYVSASFISKKSKNEIIDVSCPVYNISKSGICIIVSKETLGSVKLNEAIGLEGLSFFGSMTNEVKAVVKNARVYSNKGVTSDELYALGLEFQLD